VSSFRLPPTSRDLGDNGGRGGGEEFDQRS